MQERERGGKLRKGLQKRKKKEDQNIYREQEIMTPFRILLNKL